MLDGASVEVVGESDRLRTLDVLEQMALGYSDVRSLRDLADALHQWHRWAYGHATSPDAIAPVAAVLDNTGSIDRPAAAALVAPLRIWAAERGMPMPVRLQSRAHHSESRSACEVCGQLERWWALDEATAGTDST